MIFLVPFFLEIIQHIINSFRILDHAEIESNCIEVVLACEEDDSLYQILG